MQSLFENGINLLETFLFYGVYDPLLRHKIQGCAKIRMLCRRMAAGVCFYVLDELCCRGRNCGNSRLYHFVLCVRYVLPKRKMADQAPFVRRHLLSCLCHRDFNQSYSVQRDWL